MILGSKDCCLALRFCACALASFPVSPYVACVCFMLAWSFRVVVLVKLHSLACQCIHLASAGLGELLPEVLGWIDPWQLQGLLLCIAF